jgi:adenine-specific DNA-methyltransferase
MLQVAGFKLQVTSFSLPSGERDRVRGKMQRKNIERCRDLRKNQTDAEKKLWSVMRDRQLSGVKFRRQAPVGRYILDFYCPQCKIGIEADGGQHYENAGRKRDELRTQELNKLGVEILRFSDHDILTNIDAVFEVIQEAIEMKKGSSSV